MAQVRELFTTAAAADGSPPVSEHVVLSLRHHGPATAHLLARGASGQLSGYAQVNLVDLAAELVVHPEHRRAGLGSAMLEALLARVDGAELRLWAHGEHPAAVRLAERHGFTRARVLWQMRRSLHDPLPAVALPAGLRLRTFQPGRDEPTVVAVNNRAFAWHPEQGGWDIEALRIREAEPWFDPAGFFLAVDNAENGEERVRGFHWTKVHSGPEPVGEVYVVAVDPDAQGGGLGAALTVAGLEYLRDAGLGQVLLYVEADNAAAIRVYTKLGFAHTGSDVSFRRGPTGRGQDGAPPREATSE